MSESTYDPDAPPSISEWLGAEESERLQRVIAYHAVNPIKAGSLRAHAAIHVIVENQVASEHAPTVRALARLQEGGLSRHEALHAIGSVIAKQMYGVLRSSSGAETGSDPQARIDAGIEALDAQAWLKSHSE